MSTCPPCRSKMWWSCCLRASASADTLFESSRNSVSYVTTGIATSRVVPRAGGAGYRGSNRVSPATPPHRGEGGNLLRSQESVEDGSRVRGRPLTLLRRFPFLPPLP